MIKPPTTIMRDLVIVALSVAIAFVLVKTGFIAEFIASAGGLRFIGSFIAGMFFVSVFTAAPAAVVLVELFRVNSLFEVTLAGGLGALLGDWVMFRFLRDRISGDLSYLLKHSGLRRLLAVFRLRCFRWLTPLLGALIVASPFPDEVGLALMGLSGLRTAVFLPISFILNFFGILFIGLAVRAVG